MAKNNPQMLFYNKIESPRSEIVSPAQGRDDLQSHNINNSILIETYLKLLLESC